MEELKNLLNQMMAVTSSDKYIKDVGYHSRKDKEIVKALKELNEVLNGCDSNVLRCR